jgi:hypothetical protein
LFDETRKEKRKKERERDLMGYLFDEKINDRLYFFEQMAYAIIY